MSHEGGWDLIQPIFRWKIFPSRAGTSRAGTFLIDVSAMDPDESYRAVSDRGTGYARIDSIIGRRMELSKSDIGRSIGVARIVSLASKLESGPCQWLANGAMVAG